MKFFMTTFSAANARRLRLGLVGLAALLVAATIGISLTRVLSFSTLLRPAAAATSVDVYAPLDQHERHPSGFPNSAAPLDQHERHPAGEPAQLSADARQRDQEGGLLGEPSSPRAASAPVRTPTRQDRRRGQEGGLLGNLWADRPAVSTQARVLTDHNRRRGQEGGLLGELFGAPAQPTVR